MGAGELHYGFQVQVLIYSSQTHDKEMVAFATDASRFVGVFGSIISQSAPHIYISALPFAPQESLISKSFLSKFGNTLAVKNGKMVGWPAIQNVLEGHASSVNSVAFSPDGKHIVSGSWDNTIRVWDAVTGEVVSGPLQGHTESVNSVAFSSHVKHIVSGSNNSVIRVWNPLTEVIASAPLKSHTLYVKFISSLVCLLPSPFSLLPSLFPSKNICVCIFSDYSY